MLQCLGQFILTKTYSTKAVSRISRIIRRDDSITEEGKKKKKSFINLSESSVDKYYVPPPKVPTSKKVTNNYDIEQSKRAELVSKTENFYQKLQKDNSSPVSNREMDNLIQNPTYRRYQADTDRTMGFKERAPRKDGNFNDKRLEYFSYDKKSFDDRRRFRDDSYKNSFNNNGSGHRYEARKTSYNSFKDSSSTYSPRYTENASTRSSQREYMPRKPRTFNSPLKQQLRPETSWSPAHDPKSYREFKDRPVKVSANDNEVLFAKQAREYSRSDSEKKPRDKDEDDDAEEDQPLMERMDIEVNVDLNKKILLETLVTDPILAENLRKNFDIVWMSDMHKEVIRAIREGNHLMIKCQTGSGKSFISFISILEKVFGRKEAGGQCALVFLPSDTLVQQFKEWMFSIYPQYLKKSLFISLQDSAVEEKNLPTVGHANLLVMTPRAFLRLEDAEREVLQKKVSIIFVDEADALLQSLSAHPTAKELRHRARHLPPAVAVLAQFMPKELKKLGRSKFPQMIIASATCTSRTRSDLLNMGFFGCFDYPNRKFIQLLEPPKALPESSSDSDLVSSDQILAEINGSAAEIKSQKPLSEPMPPASFKNVNHYYYQIGRDEVKAIEIEDRVAAFIEIYKSLGSPPSIIFSSDTSPRMVYLEKLREILGQKSVHFLQNYSRETRGKVNNMGTVYLGSVLNSRGLDCKDIRLVVILDPVTCISDYKHMVGRMARLSARDSTEKDCPYTVVSFASEEELQIIRQLARLTSIGLQRFPVEEAKP